MNKEYIVTLKSKDDLEDFYAEMSSNGFKIAKKRPISRNTHYYMTAEQAEELKKDSRVIDVAFAEEIFAKREAIYNNTSYTKNGAFPKAYSYFTGLSYVQTGSSASGGIPANSIKVTHTNHDFAVNDDILWYVSASNYYNDVAVTSIVDANNFIFAIPGSPPNTSASGTCSVIRSTMDTDFNWGHLHCAGTSSQRAKGTFGQRLASASGHHGGGTNEIKRTSVDVFNDGKHVDVVICDDLMAYDSAEWKSPSSGNSRFVQYQWFNELNSIVTSIDDDGITPQTGTINYPQNANLSSSHGQHVAGTVAGQYWGWAREANIYNFAVTDPWPSPQSGYTSNYLIYDYLRAFHLNKAVNPTTGRRNPTVTNHSYSFIFYLNSDENALVFNKLSSVVYQGTTYNSGNPGPSGWTQSGVEADFGVRFNETNYPKYVAAIAADIQDAIDDGVVVVAAAGNENLLIAEENDVNYNNYIYYEYDTGDMRSSYYNRGGTVQSPAIDSICVGALGNDHNFRRTIFSNFGPNIDVFAPGRHIISAYGNTGLDDTKSGYGTGNYFQIEQGTSMASPQVCGVLATLATAKYRFSQSDAKGYLQRHCVDNDMTFDTGSGSFNDNTSQQGSPNKYLQSKNPRSTSGMIEDVKGERKTSGMTFPRRSTLNYVA